MTLLGTRVAMGRSTRSAARSLFRTRPSVSVFQELPLLRRHNDLVPKYHRFSQSPRNVDKQVQEMSPQQEALHRLGIVNDKLRSSSSSIKSERQQPEQPPETKPPPPPLLVRVRSVHAAQTFDVVKILSKVFTKYRPVRHHFGKASLIAQLKPLSPGDPFRFVAVYRFGSVVFFNMTARDAGHLLESVKKYGTKSIAAGFERRENYNVVIQPQLIEEEEVVTGDYCMVESLDMNSVSVIGNVMAQTVALDSYNDIAEELLENFAAINSSVRQSGKFTSMEMNSLFRVVAQNNSIFIDMMSKLGIKERSVTAWNLSQYEEIHDGMKEEFEIEQRFDNIELKLDMIQQNAKFFLEILHNQKSNTLEWVIIVLIAFECALTILEMSGLGTSLFAAMPQILPESVPKS